MPYFRELPLKKILLMHFILGLTTGWFFAQGIKLALGKCVFGGLQLTFPFYRLLGVQLSFFVFFVVCYRPELLEEAPHGNAQSQSNRCRIRKVMPYRSGLCSRRRDHQSCKISVKKRMGMPHPFLNSPLH